MPTTPVEASLGGLKEEALSVANVVGQRLELIILSQPKPSEVLEGLPRYNVVHFLLRMPRNPRQKKPIKEQFGPPRRKQFRQPGRRSLDRSGDIGRAYSTFLDSETEEGDGGHARVSFALHVAVATLRKGWLRPPAVWAPFIHTGT